MKEGGFFDKKVKSAKSLLMNIATISAGLTALSNTADAQVTKGKEPIYVTDKKDRRLIEYKDSSDLYKSSQEVINFYRSNPNYELKEEGHIDIKSLVFEELEEQKNHFWSHNAIAKTGVIGNGTIDKREAKALNIKDYYQVIDEYRFKQRELENSVLNLSAPFQIFDKRIKPDKYFYFEGKKGSPAEGDDAKIYSYSEEKAPKPIQQFIYRAKQEIILNKPIYVTDKNDPRLIAYNDSLTLANDPRRLGSSEKEGVKDLKERVHDGTPKLMWGGSHEAYDRLTKLNSKSPSPKFEDITRTPKSLEHNNPDYYAVEQTFRKPVQPVYYADPKFVAKQTALKDGGYYAGELDGNWGPASIKAWDKYQKVLEEKQKAKTDSTTTRKNTRRVTTPANNPEPKVETKIPITKYEILSASKNWGKNWKSTESGFQPDSANGGSYYLIQTKDKKIHVLTPEEWEKIDKQE